MVDEYAQMALPGRGSAVTLYGTSLAYLACMIPGRGPNSAENTENGSIFCLLARKRSPHRNLPGCFHIVPPEHNRFRTGLRNALQIAFLALPALLATSPTSAQTDPSPAPAPRSEPSNQLATHRFELGWHIGVTPQGHGWSGSGSSASEYFIGISAAVALNRWFALGVEVEEFAVPSDGEHVNDLHDGIRTFALAELRVPLGHEALRLFGRAAAGPALLTTTSFKSSVELAVRESIGVELRIWHVYARPFGYFATMTNAEPKLGIGFETGATF